MADKKRQQVLQSLASIDPIQLCSEARRGTYNAADGDSLYAKCIAAGLLTSGDAAVGRGYGAEEAARLHGLFDVALRNGLAVLISHYVTEVCMDASVVSSDAIEAKLLDGSVVQNWAEQTLRKLLSELQAIYADHSAKQSADLSGIAGQLRGLSYVLDALQASIVDGASPAQQRLQDLKEALLKALQHLEVFSWCSQQRWLEHLRPQHASSAAWAAAFQSRKDAAAERHWPIGAEPKEAGSSELPRFEDQSGGEESPDDETPSEAGTLFVEDALDHLGLEKSNGEEQSEPVSGLRGLAQDSVLGPGSSAGAGVEMGGPDDGQLYPPSSVRGAVDLLFLRGWASEFLAKKAIFLYYLYDRFWGRPAEEWHAVVQGYCTAFHLPDFFRIECLVFFLLDHDAPEALQEACRLLPQIAGPKLHPRIPQVLLERGAPREALSAFRASGRLLSLGFPLPLEEAVTALRAALVCGPLSEAYLFQRNHWGALRETLDVPASRTEPGEPLEGSEEPRNWGEELAVLVAEVVNFAARGGVLREMVQLPWAPEEEKPMETALVRCAERDPGGVAGSHLVVYYLLRCRCAEAMIRHKDVCRLEESWEGGDEAARRRAALAQQQRTTIVETCYQLLPEAERRLLEQQLAQPEAPSQGMDVDGAPAFGPTLPHLTAAPQSLLFSQVATGHARPLDAPPSRPMTTSSLRPASAPDGLLTPKESNGRPENGAHANAERPVDESGGQGYPDGDVDYSPRPRKLMYDEVGGSEGAADGGGANTPGVEEDGLVFHSPVGQFTPEADGPRVNGSAARRKGQADQSGYRIGASNGVGNGGDRLWNEFEEAGEGIIADWGTLSSPGQAAAGPFKSPVSLGVKRARQQTPAVKKVAAFQANGMFSKADEGSTGIRLVDGGDGEAVGLELMEDGGDERAVEGPGPPPRGTLSEDVDMTERLQPSSIFASFQLPKPPVPAIVGQTPTFLRNGGRTRWRAEEDVEDSLLDEAVASALTPGIKRSKAGASTKKSKKMLRKGMQLL